jgi:hypothetical protein
MATGELASSSAMMSIECTGPNFCSDSRIADSVTSADKPENMIFFTSHTSSMERALIPNFAAYWKACPFAEMLTISSERMHGNRHRK